ncbi:hypothetical protein UlMin_002233 [Ulmus minor]
MKFQQQWEFRKREDDLDSLDYESKSSSSSEPTHKKHKLVSSLISAENNEAISNSRDQQSGEFSFRTVIQSKFKKRKKVDSERSQKGSSEKIDLKRDSYGKFTGKKNTKTSVDELVALDDVKFLMASVLEDLKAKRECLFTWMKEEMRKLVKDDTDSHQVYNQDSFEKRTRVHSNFREKIVVQHRISSGENFQMQHHNKFQSGKLQHQSNLKENVAVQHQNNFESCTRAPNCDGGSSEKSIKSNEDSCLDNCYQTLEDLEDYGKTTRHLISSEDDGEMLALLVKPNIQMKNQEKFHVGSLDSSVEGKRKIGSNSSKGLEHRIDYDQEIESKTSYRNEKREGSRLSFESNVTSHPSSQLTSSTQLMLPTKQASFENQRLDFSSCNYVQPTVTENRIGMSSGQANPMLDLSAHFGYFSGMHQEERNKGFSRLFPGNVSCLYPTSTPTLVIGTGFPVSLHQGTNNSLNIPSQLTLENQTQQRINFSGLKMDGGAISYTGGSYAFSEQYLANKLSTLPNDKSTRLMSIQKEHLLPKQV